MGEGKWRGKGGAFDGSLDESCTTHVSSRCGRPTIAARVQGRGLGRGMVDCFILLRWRS